MIPPHKSYDYDIMMFYCNKIPIPIRNSYTYYNFDARSPFAFISFVLISSNQVIANWISN